MTELDRKFERDARYRSINQMERARKLALERQFRWLINYTVAASVAVTLIWAATVFFGKPSSTKGILEHSEQRLSERIEQMEERLKTVNVQLSNLANTHSEPTLDEETSRLAAQQKEFFARLQNLEKAISDSPEKALSIPMLRKDLEQLSIRLTSSQEAAHNDVERLYNIMVWFLGSVVTVSIAVIGFAITQLSKDKAMDRRDEKNSKHADTP